MDRHLALESLGYSVVHRPPSALADPARFAGGHQNLVGFASFMITWT